MLPTVREKLENGPMFDHAIVEHHFTPYLRDYDIIVDDVSIHKIAQGDPETNILKPTEDDGTNAGHRH